MSQLSDLLVQFRKSLHDELDRAFDRGSQDFLLKIIAENNSRFESIQQALQRITSSGPQTIPEVYNVNMNLADAVHEWSKAPNPTMELDEESVVPDNDEPEVEESAVEEPEVDEPEVDEPEVDESVAAVEESVVADEEEYVVPENDDADDEMGESVAEESVVADDNEEEALQELEVDGTTYYYDSAGNVYTLSEDGTPSEEPVGTYNTESGEFELFESEAMEEVLEEITYKNKKYYKDSQDNVYNTDMEPLPYTYTNNRFVRKA